MNLKAIIGFFVLAAAMLGLAVASAQTVQADNGKDGKNDAEKIWICHSRQPQPSQGQGNGGHNNPYGPKVIEVSKSAVFKDGHDGHNGPLFDPSDLNQDYWGDIIPPFTYLDKDGKTVQYPGMNWPAGEAWLDNNCQAPTPGIPAVAYASVTITPATCDEGEILAGINVLNATVDKKSVKKIGTEGPANFKVSATAEEGALFGNGITIWKEKVNLAGPIGYQNTNPEADCYQAPSFIEAHASIKIEKATCEIGQKLVYGPIDHAKFSGTSNGAIGLKDYDVTATADNGALFVGGLSSLNWKGTLTGKLPEQNTNPDGDCYVAPETPTTPEDPGTAVVPGRGSAGGELPTVAAPVPTPEVLPYTAGSSTPIIATGALSVASLILITGAVIKSRMIS